MRKRQLGRRRSGQGRRPRFGGYQRNKDRQLTLELLEQRCLLTEVLLDQRLMADIAKVGEMDSFELTVDEPQTISLFVDTAAGQSGIGGARLQVVTSSNQMVTEQDVLSGSPEILELQLQLADTYSIIVQAPGADTNRLGTYELHVADRDPDAAALGLGNSTTSSLVVKNQIRLLDIDVPEDALGTPFRVMLDTNGGAPSILKTRRTTNFST